jgi:hypothetical protein
MRCLGRVTLAFFLVMAVVAALLLKGCGWL